MQEEGQCRRDRGGCTRGDKGDGGMVKAGQFVHRGGIYWTVHTFIVKRKEKVIEGGMKKEEVPQTHVDTMHPGYGGEV